MRTVVEGARGCGYRKGGGLYLMAGEPNAPCSLLPLALEVCPTCGGGIKPARGWTWVDADGLLGLPRGAHPPTRHSKACPFTGELGATGLIWIGAAFYSTPESFMREARRMGISRRITAVPKGLEVGETWVLLAHRNVPELHADGDDDKVDAPGVFSAFKPERIEYVVKGDETEDELAALEKRGIEPVRVERDQAEADLDQPF
jgi:hypothetical protein